LIVLVLDDTTSACMIDVFYFCLSASHVERDDRPDPFSGAEWATIACCPSFAQTENLLPCSPSPHRDNKGTDCRKGRDFLFFGTPNSATAKSPKISAPSPEYLTQPKIAVLFFSVKCQSRRISGWPAYSPRIGKQYASIHETKSRHALDQIDSRSSRPNRSEAVANTFFVFVVYSRRGMIRHVGERRLFPVSLLDWICNRQGQPETCRTLPETRGTRFSTYAPELLGW